MKRIVGIVYVFLCWGISLHAQSVRVIETLKKLEMENISVVEKSDTITAAFETSVYRGAYNGIGIAIRHLVAIQEIPTWDRIEELLGLCQFIAATRQGCLPNVDNIREYFGELGRERIHRLATPELEISSTDIRDRIKKGYSIKYIVPEQVEQYIRKEGLYL